MGRGAKAIGGSNPKHRGPVSRQRMGTSRKNLATERKYVSILRSDLHRSSQLITDLGLEEAIARLAPALEEMRLAVHLYGGIVYREMGDGSSRYLERPSLTICTPSGLAAPLSNCCAGSMGLKIRISA